MRDPEEEIRIAVAEGIVGRGDVAELAHEARRRRVSPLALLVERGRLSDESLASLRAALSSAGVRGHADDDPTPAAPPPAPLEPAFPIPGWDRYYGERFLGQGGMGKVFLAVDPRLRREVAIKFVRGDNPEHVTRMVAEARAQARVSHPHVCKVHEVGEVDGKIYIAMQYIAGVPLASLAGELTIEQKAILVAGAADGLHEAHRAGIIHRDVKPSNIMVERGEDGALTPYVMDFGLARSAHDDGTTQSGAVLGTPRYMAPEQMRDLGPLDRRADVYSLGATLYHLLTGEPAIPGNGLLEIMQNVATMEPRPLRAIAPGVPADLEAIVLKCLEKDRLARYDSARAVADDLRRFLDGEPVRARVARWYRLRKRLAKHRRAVALAAAALAVSLVALGSAIQARRHAAERERLARRFTEQVERLEAEARYAALSPEHDIRDDRAATRARMAELEDEIGRAGADAAGAGRYALGRSYLVLDDDASARDQLEAAWRQGFHEPRAAYALALALGHLYQRELVAAERIAVKQLRDAKLRTAERQYRDPALAYLAASRDSAVPSTAYVAALVAFYEGRLDDALRQLDATAGRLWWFYEAPKLRGDILLARALQRRNQGDSEHARADLAAGRQAYAAAAEIGRSVPAVYQALGELEDAQLVLELYGSGEVQPPFDRGLAATRHALAVLPGSDDALVLEARIYSGLAEHRTDHGADADDVLGEAIADAERAVAAAPGRSAGFMELAQLFRQRGEARQGRNQDPGEPLQQAVDASARVAAVDRDALYYGNLGLIYKVWADYQDSVGADAAANRGKAIDAYTRALAIEDRLSYVWINLGINYYMRAAQPRAPDPDGDVRHALDALDRAMAINPGHVVPYVYEGQSHELIAQRARNRGGDPAPELARARDVYQRGLAINATLPHLHNGIGIVLMDQAKLAWDRGGDPEPLLDQARSAFEQAIAAAPNQGFGYDNVGEVHAQRAWLQLARGGDPTASVRAAIAALQQALKLIPDHPTFWADLATAHAIAADHELQHGRDPQPSLAQASAAVARALAINPRDAQAQLYLAQTRGVLARLHAQHGRGNDDEFGAAAQAFEQAIALAPDSGDPAILFGQFCRAWAGFLQDARRDPAPAFARGLALAGGVLAVRPDWPDARILRGSLRLAQAQHAAATSRRSLAAQAADDLARALAVNPALRQAWGRDAALAQQIASAPR